MEVKPGYKQTEVGVIPKEWEVAFLSNLTTAGPKNGYSGRSGRDARGTPTLSLTATSSGYLILNDETVKRLDETIDPGSDVFLKAGDVLVQRSNTSELVGTTAVFNGPSGVYAYPDLMMRLRFKDERTANWFWRYANSAEGRRYFVSVAAGSTGSMPKISGEKLRRMPLPTPPLPEQRAIGEALGDVDTLSRAMAQLVAKKRDLKQAAMQQLLTGKTRLPGFNGEWEADYVKNLASISTGARNTQDRREDGKYPFFVRSSTVEHIDSYSYDGEAVLTAGDGVGTGKIFHYIKGKFDFHQRVYKISNFTERVDGYFLYLFFSTHFYERIMSMTAKSSVDSVRREMIADMPIPLPPLQEQRAIATVLSDMDAEIESLEQRLAKTRSLKQGMMQELLTGRTRLV